MTALRSNPQAEARQTLLDDLADKIDTNAQKADQHIRDAARSIIEAHKRAMSGEGGEGVTRAIWCRTNLKLTDARVRELLRIGKAENQDVELALLRLKNADRQAKSRAKRKAESA